MHHLTSIRSLDRAWLDHDRTNYVHAYPFVAFPKPYFDHDNLLIHVFPKAFEIFTVNMENPH